MSADLSARDEMLARIRHAARKAPEVAIPRDYRLAGEHAPGSSELLDRLTDRLVDYRAIVHPATPETLRETVLSTLDTSRRVIVPPGLPDEWTPDDATVDAGFTPTQLDQFDTVLTGCAAAAADTGTIALDASPDQGRRAITLVPDRHVCVVRADQVVQTVPELLARLDPRRPLTLVSGPSATSDIELRRVEGVHGPRTLVVVLVRASPSA